MARPISDEELQLKKRARRRLVGAVVLVTAVAVILPMVLDSEPKPVSTDVKIDIPSPEASSFNPRMATPAAAPDGAAAKPDNPPPPVSQVPAKSAAAPVVEPVAPPPAAASKADDAKSAAKATAAPKPAATPAGDVKPADAKSAEATKPVESSSVAAVDAAATKDAKGAKDTAKDAQSAGAFVVQLAALADPAKAKQLQQKVAGTGVKAYTETVRTDKGEVTRVRAGPFPNRAAADKARAQLQAAGLDGKVVPK